MKKFNLTNILSPLSKSFMALAIVAGMSACDNIIYDFEEDCDPVEEPKPEPEPDLEPGYVRIYVRTNPGSGGTSAVSADADALNSTETQEGIYVSIDIKENEAYTLTATESNPEYAFVKWHDDTNDGDLTEKLTEITNIKAEATTRYTAIFKKIGPEEPEPDDELGNYYVRFIFDKNMQFVDGFSRQVKSVDLYVFDPSGAFVTKYHEDGVPLTAPDYLMELTDLPAGEYEFVAWCGLTNNNGHFTVPGDTEISRNYQTVCTMSTSADALHAAYQNQNLSPLFHGRNANATYVEKHSEKQIQDVELTKNTNNVSLTLQHRDGLEFAKNRFAVTMVDRNDVMKHDNSISDDAQEVEYRPYRTVIGNAAISRAASTRADVGAGSTVGNYMQVELSTARLMADHNPVIVVRDTENNNKVIFSIPLVKWALQFRNSNYKDMDNQEYLDREDHYNLMLWLDSREDDGWFSAGFDIFDWHVVEDEWNY
ncbi:MAG: FimB/Mfa2 family fimbrial subunit [Coprobacter sp.]|nr:FimB/Mfa2 family fimbrial subunit [Coprobacter sp.]